VRITWLPVAMAGLFACLCHPADAKEDSTTVRKRYDEAVASFPAPSPAHEIRFKGEVYADGVAKAGTYDLRATATKQKDGSPGWLVREQIEIDPARIGNKGQKQNWFTLNKLRPNLATTSGKQEVRTEDAKQRRRWSPCATGIQTSLELIGGRTAKETIAHEGSWLPGLGCGVLFARLALDAPGSYETSYFESGRKPTPLSKLEITIDPPTADDAVTAHIMSDGSGYEVVFDRASGKISRLTWLIDRKPIERRLVIVPVGTAPPGPGLDLFSRPARNARDAALQTVLAFLLREREMLEDAVRWRRMYDAIKQATPTDMAPFSAWKREYIAELVRGRNRRWKPEPTRAILLRLRDRLRVESVGPRAAKVHFPDEVGLEVLVVEEAGVWKANYTPVYKPKK